ncbi:MAG: hypothetical protein SFY56_09235 [Bacteroidota bacterium]|nr:hypothetical protein [Bacteroidota bacterium]
MDRNASIIFVASLLALFIIGISSLQGCKKKVRGCMDDTATNYNANATEEDNSCTYNGKLSFFYTQPATQATVTINGQTGYISTYYGYISGCENNGCANFTLPTGDYNYTAKNALKTWNGVATVTKYCTVIALN